MRYPMANVVLSPKTTLNIVFVIEERVLSLCLHTLIFIIVIVHFNSYRNYKFKSIYFISFSLIL